MYLGFSVRMNSIAVIYLIPSLNGESKDWSYTNIVPEIIPDGNYVAEFTATTPNGNSVSIDVNFSLQSLDIVSATLLPHPALAGDELIFTIETIGYADRIEIIVPSDIVDKDDRTGKYTYPLSFNVDGDVSHKTDVLRYITNVNIDKTLTPDDVRLRDPYVFTVIVYKGTNFRQEDLALDVRRSVLDLIKPGIKKVID
jgi:hypothetical protein